MHVRCPHCNNPIEILGDSSLADVTCPSCGSSFSLLSDDATVSYPGDGLRTIAHFELLARLGFGATGTVWKARDTELDRLVAIKIPRKDQIDREETEHFLREARAAAQLRHPGIASVHEVGRQDDTIYIVSDYVEGVTLADWLTSQRPTAREAADLCGKVADALHHAHEAGVIHRDLKPSNIMLRIRRDRLNPVGGSEVAGEVYREPVIMDFGLARREAGEITMTVDGNILGTPAYMSPEQARGEAHTADRRSDIYSLGVILFELLTGERPFRGNSTMLLHHVVHDPPPSPRRLNSNVPRDLEIITLKCMEKEPQRRYQSAEPLSKDLTRYLHGEPIHARPITRLTRGWRWCRRNPVVAALATALISVVLLALVTVTTLWLRAAAASTRADESGALEVRLPDRIHVRAIAPTDYQFIKTVKTLAWRIYLPSERSYRLVVSFFSSKGPSIRYTPGFGPLPGGESAIMLTVYKGDQGAWRLRAGAVDYGVAPAYTEPLEEGDLRANKYFLQGAKGTFMAEADCKRLRLFRWERHEQILSADGRRYHLVLSGGVEVWIEPRGGQARDEADGLRGFLRGEPLTD